MTRYPMRVHISLRNDGEEQYCRACGKPFRDGEEAWAVGQGYAGHRKYECDECFEKEVLVYTPMRQKP